MANTSKLRDIRLEMAAFTQRWRGDPQTVGHSYWCGKVDEFAARIGEALNEQEGASSAPAILPASGGSLSTGQLDSLLDQLSARERERERERDREPPAVVIGEDGKPAHVMTPEELERASADAKARFEALQPLAPPGSSNI